MRVYHDSDVGADTENEMRRSRIAVLGYGIQGAAQAQCLKDAGFDVVVGLRRGSGSWKRAESDGMKVATMEEAAKASDVICLLAPDMAHKEIYEESIAPNLSGGKTLYFSHGFSISYGLFKPPQGVDVIMVAPKAPGAKVRECFLAFSGKAGAAKTRGVPCLVAVHQDCSGRAREKALALAKAMRLTKAGAFECTFEQETYSDLFGEQAVLCGGMTELVKAGFETLVSRGYPPQIAYFEVLHELKLIVDLVQEGGMEFMWNRVSETARYGGRTRGKAVVGNQSRQAMHKLLDDIEDGTFASEWLAEHMVGLPKFRALQARDSQHQIEKIGKELRGAMEVA